MKRIFSILIIIAAVSIFASCQAYNNDGYKGVGRNRTYGTTNGTTNRINYGGYGTNNGMTNFTNNGTANNTTNRTGYTANDRTTTRNAIDYNTGSGNYRTDNYGNVTSIG